MPTPAELRRAFGRRAFTVRDVAETFDRSLATARATVQRLLEAGDVVRTDEVLQYVDDAGRPLRGRPQHLFRFR